MGKNILTKILDHKDLPALLLRLSLAFVFSYAAIASFVDPKEWIGYLPGILTDYLPAGVLLKFFSVYELVLVAWLLSGVYIRWAALLCAATLGGIALFNFELFAISFRDIALMFAALALAAASPTKKLSNQQK